jgi:hypothetical protein
MLQVENFINQHWPTILVILYFAGSYLQTIPGIPASLRSFLAIWTISVKPQIAPQILQSLDALHVKADAQSAKTDAIGAAVAYSTVTKYVAPAGASVERGQRVAISHDPNEDTLPAPAPTGFVMAVAPVVAEDRTK